MNTKPSMAQLSIDTQLLIQRLDKCAVGDVVEYQELTNAVGRNIQTKARSNLDTARRHLRLRGKWFGCVKNVGIKRLTDQELPGVLPDGRKRVNRMARKYMQVSACFESFDQLPDDVKQNVLGHQSIFGVILLFTRRESMKKIEKEIRDEALPVAKTITFFLEQKK